MQFTSKKLIKLEAEADKLAREVGREVTEYSLALVSSTAVETEHRREVAVSVTRVFDGMTVSIAVTVGETQTGRRFSTVALVDGEMWVSVSRRWGRWALTGAMRELNRRRSEVEFEVARLFASTGLGDRSESEIRREAETENQALQAF